MKKTNTKVERSAKRRDGALRRELYLRAEEMLRKAADFAAQKDPTWPQVYAEAGLKLIEAAKSL